MSDRQTADGPIRRAILRSSLTLTIACALWAALVLISGGFDTAPFGIQVSSHEPKRPLLLAGLALASYVLAGGNVPLAWLRALGRMCLAIRHTYIAWALAAAIVVLGLVFGSRAIGGSDSYGYVSQADLWLSGRITIDQSFALQVPWPRAQWTFSPLGYMPLERDERFIVPIYPPGLPLVMAAAKFIGGQDGLFAVSPICAGLLVLATYRIGRRLASSAAGLAAAWLLMTSPAVLLMTLSPMTDVPAAAFWALALNFVLSDSAWAAAGAGVCCGLAVLIRPNVAPLAPILFLRYVLEMRHPDTRRRAIRQAAIFAVSAVPFAVVLAMVNAHLYGSPLASGLGNPMTAFHWSNVAQNIRDYGSSLITTQTPIALAGLAAIFVPLRALWPSVRDRAVFIVLGAFVFVIWAMYLSYHVLGEWTYLRYLLPSWPLMMAGLGAIAVAIVRRAPALRVVVIAGVVALGIYQVQIVRERSLLMSGLGESRYIVAGQFTGHVTAENSVVVSQSHVGSIRYYGGRMTIRYDQIPEEWFDRLVDWLTSHGVRVYLALENWEVDQIRAQFPNAQRLDAVTRPPIGTYREPGLFYIYDLSEPRALDSVPQTTTGFYAGRPPGAAPLRPLVFR
jgi:hypothetical protein